MIDKFHINIRINKYEIFHTFYNQFFVILYEKHPLHSARAVFRLKIT